MLSDYGKNIESEKGYRAAKALLSKYYITTPEEIDLVGIVCAEDGLLDYKIMRGALGRVVFRNGLGLITVNSKITNPHRRRFVLAHELGHLVMHKESQIFFDCDARSFTDWNRIRPEETEANQFASEILMPESDVKNFIQNTEVSLEQVEQISERYQVSFTAAAIRLSRVGNSPMYVVYSESGIVKWAKPSRDFPSKYIPYNVSVPEDSVAKDIYDGEPVPSTPVELPFLTWFPGSFNTKYSESTIFEQCIHSSRFNNMVVSILWMT